MPLLHKIAFGREPDLVHLRRIVRRLARLLGFDQRDEVKLGAAVSELTRAAGATGGAVAVELSVVEDRRAWWLVIEVSAPGLAAAARERGSIAAESVIAAEKLLERGAEPSAPDTLRLAKPLTGGAPVLSRSRIAAIRAELELVDPPQADLARDELLQQAHELAGALLDVEERKQELATLNAELSDTNRGVMALYAELDERASHLRRAGELKTRFFSQMSHEFRTPLNSILALSNMLLDEVDGPLADEQRRQVRLIRDGVAGLLELVGDLLDLAKMDAGKTQVTPAPFTAGALFGALRAMIRPLLGVSAVALEFASAADLPPLVTDEGKVMQILRNFLSNAVKFTERGTIAVSARLVAAGENVGDAALDSESVLFAVADTGIGIAAEHQAMIFEEFRQVENRLQRKARGTGLGLPLCRRLAGLLGGRVWVESEAGHGATFYLQVPRVHREAAADADEPSAARPKLLIVDERADRRAALGEAFRETPFVPVEAATADVTPASLAAIQPTAAIVDAANAAPAALAALRAAAVPLVPVLVPEAVALTGREQLVADTYRAVLRTSQKCILVIDDDEAYRTILAKQLAPFCERVRAISDPQAGLAAAGGGSVDCLVLDVMMPELDGLTLLQRLREAEATARLPVVVCSSKALSADEQALARRLRAPFLPKDRLSAPQVARALMEARRLVELFGRDVAGSAA